MATTILDQIAEQTATSSGAPAPATVDEKVAREEREKTERERRLKEQERLARAGGFALPETVVTWGSKVNQVGVENARRFRAEYLARPTLEEAMTNTIEQIDRERRIDIPLRLADLKLDDSTGLLITKGSTHELTASFKDHLPTLRYNDVAWSHLLSMIPDVPQYAAGYTRDLPPDWRAYEFRRMLERGANGKTVIARVRHPDGDLNNPVLYAVVSESYTPYGVREACETVRNMVRDGRLEKDLRADVAYHGGSATIDIVGHSDLKPEKYAAGDVFRGGMRITPTDDKSARNKGCSWLERNLCLNLIILGQATSAHWGIRHLGPAQALEAAMVAGIMNSRQAVEGFFQEWGIAQQRPVDDVLAQVRLLCAAEENMKKNQAIIAVPGVEPLALVNYILTAYNMEPDETRQGVVNAISRAPQTGAYPDALEAETILATGAAKLLTMVDWPAPVAAGAQS